MKRARCNKCGLLKDRKQFPRDATRANGIFPWCKSCHSAKQKEYRKDPPIRSSFGEECPVCASKIGGAHFNRIYCGEKCKNRAKKMSVYGLSAQEADRLRGNGKCPLCLRNVTKWNIDHNHVTGETMGAVCTRCNQYLLVGCNHDLGVAKRLVEYLTISPVERLLGEKRYTGPTGSSQLARQWGWSKNNPTPVKAPTTLEKKHES